jgi:hypothetical protein
MPPIQLPLKNQLEVNVPVQSLWACVETVDAATSAIAASNVDETNLPAARAGDVAPRHDRMDDSRRGLDRNVSPQSIGNANSQKRVASAPGITETRGAKFQGATGATKHNLRPDCRNCGDGECSFVF